MPGMEHMVDFASRINRGLHEIIVPHMDTIIVGTTSTINAMNHLMEKNGQFIRKDYKFTTFPFSGINVWSLSQSAPPKKIFSSF